MLLPSETGKMSIHKRGHLLFYNSAERGVGTACLFPVRVVGVVRG